MTKRSAGLLLYRECEDALEVFLVHPGGPFWTHKDAGAWSLPKGEYTGEEQPLDAAQREFREETGWRPTGPFLPLGEIRQSGGKIVTAWAFRGDADPATLVSNTHRMEWPPHSGHLQEFPEVDRGAWFPVAEAATRLLPAQVPLVERLRTLLKSNPPAGPEESRQTAAPRDTIHAQDDRKEEAGNNRHRANPFET